MGKTIFQQVTTALFEKRFGKRTIVEIGCPIGQLISTLIYHDLE